MSKAQNDAVKLQKELQDLTENLSKLNKIYVGMYDAMHKQKQKITLKIPRKWQEVKAQDRK